jgi:hypothetical protein
MFRQCVTSLLEQSYPGHIEIMCVVDYEDPKEIKEGDSRGDMAYAESLQHQASKGGYPGVRSVRIKRGPGRSNWRPGSIHYPIFEHWIQTKCDFVSYQFSDEWSGKQRIELQMKLLLGDATYPKWSYCRQIEWVNRVGQKTGSRRYEFDRSRVPCNQLMTPSIIVHRNSFEDVGGLDFPLHAAAKAEEWIQTHCALLGEPNGVLGLDMYFFREHLESLGGSQTPGTQAYKDAILETGFVEEDHWRLWGRIANEYDVRVARARTL